MTNKSRADLLKDLLAAGLIDAKHLSSAPDEDSFGDPVQAIKSIFGADDPERLIMLKEIDANRKQQAEEWHSRLRYQATAAAPLGLKDLPQPKLLSQKSIKTTPIELLTHWRFVQIPKYAQTSLPKVSHAACSKFYRDLKQSETSPAALHYYLDLLYQLPESLVETIRLALPERDDFVNDTDLKSSKRAELLDSLANNANLRQTWRLFQLDLNSDEKDRACCLWTARFGKQSTNWAGWETWIQRYCSQISTADRQNAGLILWLHLTQDPDKHTLCSQLGALIQGSHPLPSADEYALYFSAELKPEDWQQLMGGQPATPEIIPELAIPTSPVQQVTHMADTPTLNTAPLKKEKTVKVKPIIEKPKQADWLIHIKAFIDEHWILLAGALMILGGTALLTYYTWDKHWLVRYTLLPSLLAGLTAGLAKLGSWLEKRQSDLVSTATILRGLAVGLLPTHALVPALIAQDVLIDQNEAIHFLALPFSFVIYTLLIGFALRRWCGAVHSCLKGSVSLALGSHAALVALSPCLLLFFPHVPILIIGAYICALFSAWAIHSFTRTLSQDGETWPERISWFVGGTLAACFIQALAWSHSLASIKPQVTNFGLLVCGIGWMILLIERRANRRQHDKDATPEKELRSESFLGYAAIILGLVLSFANPYWRIATLICAAAAWYDQARGRKSDIHWWIASMLAAASGLALAAIPALSHDYRSIVTLATAIILFTSAQLLPPAKTALIQALRGTGVSCLVISVCAAAVLHWHFAANQAICAMVMVLAALICAWQACLENRMRWSLLSACMAVLSLPYLGCVDLANRSFHGNHLVAGLSAVAIIWALIGRIKGAQCIKQSRSLIGFTLGILACFSLILRIIFESGRAGEASILHMSLDYGGSIAMTGVLIAVAWWSRSLIPGLLSCFIMIILFPELKAQFSQAFENLGWGSGLGGTITGFILAISLFPLRKAKFLKSLSSGDTFYPGHYFPWQRFDHTLITWPILCAVTFLCLRVDTWTVFQNLNQHQGHLPVKTFIALGLSFCTWILFIIYRGPAGVSATFKRRVRQLLNLVVFWVMSVTSFCYLIDQTPKVHWSFILSAPFLLGLMFSYLLPLSKNIALSNAALRLRQTVTRLIVPLGGLGLIHLFNRGNPLDNYVLMASAALIAGIDCFKSSRRPTDFSLIKGIWFWGLIFAWYMAWSFISYAEQTDLSTFMGLSYQESVLCCLVGLSAAMFLQAGREYLWRRRRLLKQDAIFGQTLSGWCQALLLTLSCIFSYKLLFSGQDIGALPWLLLVACLFVQAYLQSSWIFLMLAISAAFLCLEHNNLLDVQFISRIKYVIQPTMIFYYGSVLALFSIGIRYVQQNYQQIPSIIPSYTHFGDQRILLGSALGLSLFAFLQSSALDQYHDSNMDILLCYASLIPAILCLTYKPWHIASFIVIVLGLTLANIQCVRFYGVEFLSDLHSLHSIGIGMAISALMLSAINLCIPRITQCIRISNLVLAGLLLMLISANYMAHPNLDQVSAKRFIVSALMAIIAGRAFRHLAHGELSSKTVLRVAGTAIYHFSVSLAICCALLCIPALRSPAQALIALAVPVFYLYLRAECHRDTDYRNSTVILGCILVFLTLFRSAFLLLLFPESMNEIGRHDHYHDNAFVLFGLGLILLRCAGLGADRLIAMIGGLTVIISSWLMICSLPDLSPFTNTINAAWCAIALAHFFTLATNQRSPIRDALLRLLQCNGEAWHSLRREWGIFMLGACHVIGFIALSSSEFTYYGERNFLLLALSSLFLYHGLIRQCIPYFWLAFIEMVCALHLHLVFDQCWNSTISSYAVLGLWFILLYIHSQTHKQTRIPFLHELRPINGLSITPLALLTYIHIFSAAPDSFRGLLLGGLVIILTALSPMRTQHRKSCYFLIFTLLHFCFWLSVANGFSIFSGVPLAVASVVLMIIAVISSNIAGNNRFALQQSEALCLQQLGDHFQEHGLSSSLRLHYIVLFLAGSLLLLCSILPNRAPEPALATLLIILGTVQAWIWYKHAHQYERMRYLFFAQAAIGITIIVVRQLLREHVPGYQIEYDVWGSLVLSSLIAGGRQLWDDKPRHIHLPLAWSAALLPASTLVWIIYHHLSTDLALIAIALHSIGFAHIGRGKNKNSFQAISILGFVGFALLCAWSKFELRVIHAYTIPTGIGILFLTQLFHRFISIEKLNVIRSLTLLIMLGSSAWHAMFDASHPIIFHATMLITALGVLAVGSYLRIRMYIMCGFAGVLVAVSSLCIHGLTQVDRGLRMSLIGGLILIAGAMIVGGTIYLKAKREQVIAFIQRLKDKAKDWE